MATAPDIYVYKMVTDNGGAPCVHRGMLSLAICKPKIRKTAKRGALVFGFGGRRLGGRLIYVAKVTEKPCVGDYYRKKRFHGRPDCIYRKRKVDNKPKPIKDAKFHYQSDESGKDVGRDFKKAYVLLSTDFRYFGKAGTTDYSEQYKALSKMLSRLTQGHRRNHNKKVREELCQLKMKLWKNFPRSKIGKPSDRDKSRRCNADTPSVRCSVSRRSTRIS